MPAAQLVVVPQISTLPLHESKAMSLLNWLVKQRIVQALPSTCGVGGNGMAYGIDEGARRIALYPEKLPFAQRYNGLEIITKRCVYTPTRNFLEEAGCPQCRQEIGVPLFASLEEWSPGETDVFCCPECGFEDDINGFLYLQPCAFSNLGFIFNGWAQAGLRPAFVESFAERLGFAVRQVIIEDPL